jgi:rare lipoprotein A
MARKRCLHLSVLILLAAFGGCAQQSATRAVPPKASAPVAGSAPVAIPVLPALLPPREDAPRCIRFSEKGMASWYGRKYQGRRTASGERFDMNRFTAAHRELPFGTRIDVTNLENGRTASVVVNDRGPYGPGRVLDVSRRVAAELGFVRAGLARVLITGDGCGRSAGTASIRGTVP